MPHGLKLKLILTAYFLRKELGDGETAAIALAFTTKADLIILDDLAARNVAAELGLNVTGTIGVIMAAHHKGILNAKEALDDVVVSGFRISQALISNLITSQS